MHSGGVVSPEDTDDHEEKEQCIKMHEIIGQYKLDGEFRSVIVCSQASLLVAYARSDVDWRKCMCQEPSFWL